VRNERGAIDPWAGCIVAIIIIVWSAIAFLNGSNSRHESTERYKARVAACTHLVDQKAMQKCISDAD
jgi:hypothetical protein